MVDLDLVRRGSKEVYARSILHLRTALGKRFAPTKMPQPFARVLCWSGAMHRYVSRIAPFILAFSAAGCGTYIPEIREPWDTDRTPTVSANGILEYRVKEKVYCAIYDAVRAQKNLPKGWAVQSTLDLQVDQTGALNPGLSYLLPFNAAESFTLGVGATFSSQSTREDKFGSYWDLDRLSSQWTNQCIEANTIPGSSPLITNELGLTQWLTDALENNRVLPSSPQAKNNTFDQDSLTYHVKFIIITTGTLNPTFKLVKFSSSYNGNLASVNRTRTHDILLTFGPKFKPNSPNIPLTQHSSTEFGIAIGNNVRVTTPVTGVLPGM